MTTALPALHTRISSLVRKHWFVLVIAVAIGALYVAPHVAFIVSLGEGYKGIPMMHTANEDFYLARIQEILDGHPSLGSPGFWEYKMEVPLSPPVGEFLYALPSLIFGVSPSVTLVGSRFVLPALLFLLVFFLIRRLIGDDNSRIGKCAALAGALFVTLGYDLIDYRSILHFLAGKAPLSSGFLLWSRPVNPILGAIFLFSFLLLVWSLFTRREKPALRLAGAALFLALMFGSYFFSWGMALSVLAALITLLLLRKEYQTAGTLARIAPLGALLALPYWIGVWRAAQSPWYESSVLRSGLFLTHYPLLNKLLLVALLFFILAVAFDFFLKRKRGLAFFLEPWHIFCLALHHGGMWAKSHQVITGRTIWPYHFVQYTIPLAIIVTVVVVFHLRRTVTFLSNAFFAIAIISSLSYGIYAQTSSFLRFYEDDRVLQSFSPLFEWLNQREPDCVVLVVNQPPLYDLEGLIPAFTHCNTYHSMWVYSLMPDDRILHNYLTRLFFKGLSPESVETYLAREDGAYRYLFSNWKGLYRVPQFPDFSDSVVYERIRNVPRAYREFVGKDIERELKKYRLDYILSMGPLDPQVQSKLPGTKLITIIEALHLYEFR